MARSSGISSVFKGRAGDKVFYRIKTGKFRQGMRIHVAEISNPKTIGQARQRMVLTPVTNLYRALKSIITRGFEGKQYGYESRLRYQSLAMKNFNGPYVPKGYKEAIPAPFTITEGSLVPIVVSGKTATDNAVLADAFITDLLGTVAANATIGDVSSSLIDSNTDVQEGDQITLVYAVKVGNSFVWRNFSFLVEVGNTTTLSSIGLNVRSLTNGGSLVFRPASLNADETLVAAAVIQSREGDAGQHLRSTSVIFVDTAAVGFFDASAYGEAIASYMSDAQGTDWPQVPTDADNDVANLVILEILGSNLEQLPAGYTVTDAVPVLGYMTSGGQTGIFGKLVNDNTAPDYGRIRVYSPAGEIYAASTENRYTSADLDDVESGTIADVWMPYDASYGNLA